MQIKAVGRQSVSSGESDPEKFTFQQESEFRFFCFPEWMFFYRQ
jgi:hypothetical protein